MGPNLSEDLFFIYLFVLHLALGARLRSSYPLEKFLSEALLRTNYQQNGSQDFTCRKLNSSDNSIAMLHTSALKVINPHTGESTLAYSQQNTASQVTLTSNALKNELGLETNSDPNIKIRTLADETVDCKGRTAFILESLHARENFVIEDAGSCRHLEFLVWSASACCS